MGKHKKPRKTKLNKLWERGPLHRGRAILRYAYAWIIWQQRHNPFGGSELLPRCDAMGIYLHKIPQVYSSISLGWMMN